MGNKESQLLERSDATTAQPTLRELPPAPLGSPILPLRVCIIGAGAAGIAAARLLRKKGVENIILLEARDRIGGRAVTSEALSVPVDLGPSFMHGYIGNPILDLYSAIGMKGSDGGYGTEAFDCDGAALSPDLEFEARRSHQRMMSECFNRSQNMELDLSIMDMFKEMNPEAVARVNKAETAADRYWQWMWQSTEDFNGASLSELSAIYYFKEKHLPGGNVYIKHGYQRIMTEASRGIDIRLNHVVSSIEYQRDSIEEKRMRCVVSTNEGANRFECDAVLVTIPLGVLKEIHQRDTQSLFVPQLPEEKRQAIKRVGFGLLNKIILCFPSIFWKEDTDTIRYISRHRGEFPWFKSLYCLWKKPILVCFVCAEFAKSLEPLGDNEITSRVMSVLRLHYPSAPDPSGVLITRWGQDQFTRGSYSFSRFGATDVDYDVLAAKVGNSLYFAGEHTCRDYPGTVHGAWMSGQKAASELLLTLASIEVTKSDLSEEAPKKTPTPKKEESKKIARKNSV